MTEIKSKSMIDPTASTTAKHSFPAGKEKEGVSFTRKVFNNLTKKITTTLNQIREIFGEHAWIDNTQVQQALATKISELITEVKGPAYLNIDDLKDDEKISFAENQKQMLGNVKLAVKQMKRTCNNLRKYDDNEIITVVKSDLIVLEEATHHKIQLIERSIKTLQRKVSRVKDKTIVQSPKAGGKTSAPKIDSSNRQTSKAVSSSQQIQKTTSQASTKKTVEERRSPKERKMELEGKFKAMEIPEGSDEIVTFRANKTSRENAFTGVLEDFVDERKIEIKELKDKGIVKKSSKVMKQLDDDEKMTKTQVKQRKKELKTIGPKASPSLDKIAFDKALKAKLSSLADKASTIIQHCSITPGFKESLGQYLGEYSEDNVTLAGLAKYFDKVKDKLDSGSPVVLQSLRFEEIRTNAERAIGLIQKGFEQVPKGFGGKGPVMQLYMKDILSDILDLSVQIGSMTRANKAPEDKQRSAFEAKRQSLADERKVEIEGLKNKGIVKKSLKVMKELDDARKVEFEELREKKLLKVMKQLDDDEKMTKNQVKQRKKELETIGPKASPKLDQIIYNKTLKAKVSSLANKLPPLINSWLMTPGFKQSLGRYLGEYSEDNVTLEGLSKYFAKVRDKLDSDSPVVLQSLRLEEVITNAERAAALIQKGIEQILKEFTQGFVGEEDILRASIKKVQSDIRDLSAEIGGMTRANKASEEALKPLNMALGTLITESNKILEGNELKRVRRKLQVLMDEKPQTLEDGFFRANQVLRLIDRVLVDKGIVEYDKKGKALDVNRNLDRYPEIQKAYEELIKRVVALKVKKRTKSL